MFGELLYADDTIIYQRTQELYTFLFIKVIQAEGENTGLRLNSKKTEVITLGKGVVAAVKFKDGTPIKQATKATYLGVEINTAGDPNKELRLRISNTMMIWKKIWIIWKSSDCSVRLKNISL